MFELLALKASPVVLYSTWKEELFCGLRARGRWSGTPECWSRLLKVKSYAYWLQVHVWIAYAGPSVRSTEHERLAKLPNDRSSIPGRDKDSPHWTVYRPALRPTKHFIQWVKGLGGRNMKLAILIHAVRDVLRADQKQRSPWGDPPEDMYNNNGAKP